MRKVDGVEYLYQRGSTFLVRVQVPAPLQKLLKRTEFKKSLGGDLRTATRTAHAWKAKFFAEIEAVRQTPPRSLPDRDDPTRQEIDIAIWNRFQKMEGNLRGRSLLGGGDTSRLGRLAEVDAMLEIHLSADADRQYAPVEQHVRWLCDDHGWKLDEQSATFGYLCEGYLRARIEFLRRERAVLTSNRAMRADNDPLFDKHPPKGQAEPETLGALIDEYKKAHGGEWSKSTEKNYTIIFRLLEEIGGRDKPLQQIDRQFCEGIRDTLKRMPAHYQKRPATRGRPISEVIEIAAKMNLPVQMPATINAHLAKLGAVMRFGGEKGWITGSPAAKLQIRDNVEASEKRYPFSDDQLQQIFRSSVWSPGTPDREGRPQRFWVPLIALFTGARLGEIVALRTGDFDFQRGALVMKIRNDASHRQTKGRKSRDIPVHSTLVALGLGAFIEKRRSSGAHLLFEGEKENSLAHWGDGLSDWFARVLDKLGMRDRKLTFHSFRHSFEDALRQADLHLTPIGNAITGRDTPGVSARYGSTYSTAKLVEAVERVKYPGLNLDHLISEGVADATG